MKEARMRFSRSFEHNGYNFSYPTGAYVELASTHYSLVKRYISPAPIWKRYLALWHMRKAVIHVRQAEMSGLSDYNQIDVVSTILRKAPRWLGGSPMRALQLIEKALGYSDQAPNESAEMFPHTRALLLVGLGECELIIGLQLTRAACRFDDALALENKIFAESDKEMAQRQWVRILFAVGIFFFDNPITRETKAKSVHCLTRARVLAKQSSFDQYKKISQECAKRGL